LVVGDNPAYIGNLNKIDSKYVNWTIVFTAAGTFNLNVTVTGKYNNTTPVEKSGYTTVNVLPREEHDLAIWFDAPPSMLTIGSTCLLNVTVYNVGRNNETNVESRILINDSLVNVTTIPELQAGSEHSSSYLWTPTTEGIYNITAYAPPVSGENITTNNVKTAFVEVYLLPNILIVADDDATSVTGNGTSLPQFKSALTAAGFDYFAWSEKAKGHPPLSFLLNFKLVIWTCGDNFDLAVDQVDAETLKAYFNQGGTIVLEGEDIGFTHQADDFMVNVAHAIYQTDNTGAPGLTVTRPTHPVTSGLPTNFIWASDPLFDDGVIPTNGGIDVINYTATAWTAVTVFNGSETAKGSVVYYAFPLYCLEQSIRDTLVKNSVIWLLECAYVHDVSVTELPLAKTIIGQGQSFPVSVVVHNQGGFLETFNVTAYANASTIGKQQITLNPGQRQTLTFTWNTTEWLKGNYAINASADQVLGETNIVDNSCTYGMVRISIPGDFNGDGVVNDDDANLVRQAWQSRRGEMNYNPNADFNMDGIINIKDAAIIGVNWQKHT
jgi:hypothetical protein